MIYFQTISIAFIILLFPERLTQLLPADETGSSPVVVSQQGENGRISVVSEDVLRQMIQLQAAGTQGRNAIQERAGTDRSRKINEALLQKKYVPVDGSRNRAMPALEQIGIRTALPGVQSIDPGKAEINIHRYHGWRQLNESYTCPGAGLPKIIPIFSVTPLRYNPTLRQFQSVVRFVLFDPGRGEATALPEAMRFFFFSSVLDGIEPEEIVLDSTNGESRTLLLRSENPYPPMQFRMYTYAQSEGVTIDVDIEPVLLFASGARSLQGWGLEKTPVTVLLRGADSTKQVMVGFSVDKGSILPSTQLLRGGEFVTVQLRSRGTGEATIEVSSARYSSQKLTVYYVFPWMFFLSALIGGVLGSLVVWLLDNNEKTRIQTVRFFFGWSLFGLIAAVLYLVLGVNIIGIEVYDFEYFNEIIVLALAASAPIIKGMFRKPEKPVSTD